MHIIYRSKVHDTPFPLRFHPFSLFMMATKMEKNEERQTGGEEITKSDKRQGDVAEALQDRTRDPLILKIPEKLG